MVSCALVDICQDFEGNLCLRRLAKLYGVTPKATYDHSDLHNNPKSCIVVYKVRVRAMVEQPK